MPSDRQYQQFRKELKAFLPKKQSITDPAICHALATDASFYRLTPKLVLKIASIDQMVSTIKQCKKSGIPYTFRAAGTSLSGQAISDSVLIMLTDDWDEYQIHNNGEKISLQSNIIGAKANHYLKPYGKKIGPDPASINSCKVGGIAANNASGMCCGVAQNSYQTLDSMTVVLHDGTVLNTGDHQSIADFRQSHGNLLDEIKQLSIVVKEDKTLGDLISRKFKLKNTSGYSLNALTDFEDPIDILQHLMIGSEGTLGFIADITYRTVDDPPFKASGLYIFKSIDDACHAVEQLASEPVSAVELMDGASLKSIQNKIPLMSTQALHSEQTALLIECQADSYEQLQQQVEPITDKLNNSNVNFSIPFTQETETTEMLWQIRKGLFPSVAAIRATGTTVIIEDIAFPLEKLADGTRQLQQLFEKHGYDDAIIFGHALNGNLHFVICPDFNQPAEIERYVSFMRELTEMVAIKFGGSLKAEHGTGRNMAPFVELEWGAKAYQLMKQIKQIFDPDGLMNPDVILTTDKSLHSKNLKPIPQAHSLIDHCMECGFCESVCPSRELTLTPRQRIAMYRNWIQLKDSDPVQAKAVYQTFDYHGIQTCATTGVCKIECPVGINTGDLVKKLKSERKTNWLSAFYINHLKAMTNLTKGLLKISSLINKLLPASLFNLLGKGLHLLSLGKIPKISSNIPTAAKSIPNQWLKTDSDESADSLSNDNQVIYFPTCASRTFGNQSQAGNIDLNECIHELLTKAGFQVIYPENFESLCCGQVMESEGSFDLAESTISELEKHLLSITNSGEISVIMDNASCNLRARNQLSEKLNVYDAIEFAVEHLLDRLTIQSIDETVLLHITCSDKHMAIESKIRKLIQQCTTKVIETESIACCGWAGHKGFTTPELNQSALKKLNQQVPKDCKRGFSNSLTCEIGLSHYAEVPFQSVLYLLNEVSESKKS